MAISAAAAIALPWLIMYERTVRCYPKIQVTILLKKADITVMKSSVW